MSRKKPNSTIFLTVMLLALVVVAACVSWLGARQETPDPVEPLPLAELTPSAPQDPLPGKPIGERRRELSTPQDLIDLAEWVNSGADDAGYTWYLANDIDMKGRDWMPIGGCFGTNKNEPARIERFDGQFFGEGHTVSNISCLQSGFHGVGFFGSIGPESSITQLHVQGSFAGEGNVGGIVGISSSVEQGSLIAGCSFSGDIYTLDSNAGGIIGSAGERTIVLSCFSNANVYGRSQIGALVGYAGVDSQLRDCSCVGNVTAYASTDILKKTKLQPLLYPVQHYEQLDTASSIGGLVGAANDVFLLKNCVSNVKVTSAIPAQQQHDFIGSYRGQFNFNNFCAVEGNAPISEQVYPYGAYRLWVYEINKAEMAKEDTFVSFDFSTQWKMNPEYNIPSPVFSQDHVDTLFPRAPFRLGTQGEPFSLKQGDSLGPWQLTALDITETDGSIRSMSSMFRGEVSLEGVVERNPLLPDESYIFTVTSSELDKLPVLDTGETPDRDTASFMLRIPEGLENHPRLEHGESMPAQITIRSYCHTFGRTMTMDGADVVSIVLHNDR